MYVSLYYYLFITYIPEWNYFLEASVQVTKTCYAQSIEVSIYAAPRPRDE